MKLDSIARMFRAPAPQKAKGTQPLAPAPVPVYQPDQFQRSAALTAIIGNNGSNYQTHPLSL